MLLSLAWVFIVTFVVFPGAFFQPKATFEFLDFIEDKDERGSWYSLMVILIFNVFDTVGRYSGGIKVFPAKLVIFLSLLRTVFIVTTVGFALEWSPLSVFGSDFFRVLNLVVFSVSNGFVSTQCAIIAPSCVKDD